MENIIPDKQNNIGTRIKETRKRRGLNQKDLADLLNKSLRTVQKYESGDIEVSIAMINEIAKHLNVTSTYLLGHKTSDIEFTSLADVMEAFFKLSLIKELDFSIDVKRPPNYDEWSCSITFNGKEKDALFNADICLFLEKWRTQRDNYNKYWTTKEPYEEWLDKNLAYYSASPLNTEELTDVDNETRVKKRDTIIEAEIISKGKKEI